MYFSLFTFISKNKAAIFQGVIVFLLRFVGVSQLYFQGFVFRILRICQGFFYVKIEDSFLEFRRVILICSNKDLVCIRILAVFLRSWDVFFVIIQGFRWENTLLIDINCINIKGVKSCKKGVERVFFCLN